MSQTRNTFAAHIASEMGEAAIGKDRAAAGSETRFALRLVLRGRYRR